ncbi:MAG: heme-binding protein, partial [Marinomonas sp.]
CSPLPASPAGQPRVANGIQIFPGSVPIYRGNELIGGIGVSGDGIDQDDMVSFLGLHNAGVTTGSINNAPNDIRADRIVVDLGDAQVRLRYVNCPFAPFLDDPAQNVCEGL